MSKQEQLINRQAAELGQLERYITGCP